MAVTLYQEGECWTASVWLGKGRKRPKVRLGAVSQRQAEGYAEHIGYLALAVTTGQAIPRPTVAWLGTCPDTIRERLARHGLIEAVERPDVLSLGQWLDQYFAGRGDVKASTTIAWSPTKRNLLDFFGADKPLDSFTAGDGDAFAVYLRTVARPADGDTPKDKPSGLSDNTARRRLGIAKQFMRAAIRRKLMAENPFDGQVTAVRDNPRRRYFVTRKETDTVLAALPDAAWRLAFALIRYAGLRCPTEVLRLKWEDVSWDTARFTVHACKTEHHADAGIRVVPIFPELAERFQAAFDAAEPGAVYCCPQYAVKIAGQMYRKIILAAITAKGLKPWPKLFQNCRASRETELAESYPLQVVCQWIGHTPAVAAKHYLQVTDEHYARAAGQPGQNPGQSVADSACPAPTGPTPETPETARDTPRQAQSETVTSLDMHMVGATGFEPVTSAL